MFEIQGRNSCFAIFGSRQGQPRVGRARLLLQEPPLATFGNQQPDISLVRSSSHWEMYWYYLIHNVNITSSGTFIQLLFLACFHEAIHLQYDTFQDQVYWSQLISPNVRRIMLSIRHTTYSSYTLEINCGPSACSGVLHFWDFIWALPLCDCVSPSPEQWGSFHMKNEG